MSAAQLAGLVVLHALTEALASSMRAMTGDCTTTDVLIRAGNNAAMAISFLVEE